MTDLVLVNPPLSLKDLYQNLSEGGSELPPLGICTLAAVAREAGYSVAILDAMALRLDARQTHERLLELKPRHVGLTSTTMSIHTAAEVARLCKASGWTTLLGGSHFTAVQEETFRRYPFFDYGVIGEGEDTLIELLRALDSGQNPEEVPGLLLHLGEGETRRTPPRAMIEELDRLPLPAWDLLPDLATYYQPAVDSLNRFPASSLVTSRGCPAKCLFCDRSVFGRKIRAFSADYVLRMIKTLREDFGIRDLFIHDDNFLVLYKRTRELCERLTAEKVDITWSCLGRTDMVDWSVLPLMKKAGCWQINYGIESGSQEILDRIAKGTRLEAAEEAIRKTKEAGIRVKGLFMIGCFGETHQTIEETLRFIRKLDLDDFHMTCFTPLPGSEAYTLASQYGQFDPSWEKMNMFNAENFVPHGLTRKELEKAYRRAYRVFYMRPRILLYYCSKLRSPAMIRKIFKSGMTFLRFTLERQN